MTLILNKDIKPKVNQWIAKLEIKKNFNDKLTKKDEDNCLLRNHNQNSLAKIKG